MTGASRTGSAPGPGMVSSPEHHTWMARRQSQALASQKFIRGAPEEPAQVGCKIYFIKLGNKGFSTRWEEKQALLPGKQVPASSQVKMNELV